MGDKSARLTRFGPYEVDVRSGELRREGEKVRLPEQSFQVLAMLLERPRELVTRQEIQKRLWPNDTVVEFENSINAAIKRLRLALEDSADKPRYVETLARRGYRWMTSVEQVEAPSSQPSPPPSPKAEPSPAVLIGKKVSHYRVLEVLGGGGMGIVYAAEDLKLGRRVALKFLPEELAGNVGAIKRFGREAQTASALNHRNICTIYEVEEEDGHPFIAMELLEGQTLRDFIAAAQREGSLPLKTILSIGIQIADGLDAAHQKGIIHRDIKPANIFVGTKGQVKILDFGLAKLQSESGDASSTATAEISSGNPALSRSSEAMGTAGYMSPEQIRGERVDARTDLFSFGVILYEMATGLRAFTGDSTPALKDAILNHTPMAPRQLLPDLPPQLVAMIARALQKDREQRYQSSAEMRSALQSLADEQAASGPREIRESKNQFRWAGAIKSLWALLLAGVLLFAVLLVASRYYKRIQAARKLSNSDTIVLADFSNTTGDPVFDDSLKQATNLALRQSPFLNILSDRAIRSTLKLMTRPPKTALTSEIAREVCERAGSKAYVAGAIASLGSEYVLQLKAVNCLTGRTMAQEQFTAENKDKVLDALDSTAAKLRAELGESLATVTQFDVPLRQATTSSLEALKEYSLGNQAGRDQGPPAAMPHHLRAIQLDPNFAMAYLNTGIGYSIMSENERAVEFFTKAFQLRDHASEREKLYIAGLYYYAVTGELDNAGQMFQKIIDSYPRDVAPYTYFGLVYARKGEYEKTVETDRRIYPLAADNLDFVAGLARFELALQHVDEAKQILADLQKRKMDGGQVRTLRYSLAFLTGDSNSLQEQLQWFQSKGDGSGSSLQSDTEAYGGHLGKARELTAHAVESELHNDDKEGAALMRANAALREAAFGNAAQARQEAEAALKITPASQGVEFETALAFAMAGDTARAESLSANLRRQSPLDTQMQLVWLPTIAAQSSLSQKKPAAAIDLLPPASTMELGYVSFNAISCLYPVYVRAQSYLAAGDGNASALEFQKILDHNGIVLNCPTGVLAHLGLARSNMMIARKEQGAVADAARTRARAAFQDFFQLWKNAEPNIPVLKAAKAEYAPLQ